MMDIGESALGIIRLALAEDLGVEGDVTTTAVCPPEATGRAAIISRGPCRVAGGPVAAKVFELAGPGATYQALVADGRNASPGVVIARVEGPLCTILAGERTALNFLCHLCGIATLTARLVDMAAPFGVKIMDTRKTNPGMRPLEKYAVALGGGTNHRQGLFDAVLIKDNHIAAAGGIEVAVRRARNAYGERFPIEVEAATLGEVREAVDSGADIIMLDNMKPSLATDAVSMIDGRAMTEVSGGVTPDNLGEYVKLGVDAISLGFITHSAPAADLSLELEVG
jgi:nicotinate-nucleotide pyrophosphorylase (carboxylating)